MDPAYGARYAELYRRHWWWRAREEYLLRLLDRVVGPGGAGEVFDFGCGDGLFFDALQRYGAPRGLEPDLALLDPAGRWRSRIETGALTDEPAQRGRYGLVLALDVLEHIADPAPAIAILRARLKPGGLFIATVPAFMSLWTAHDVVNHHVRRYRLAELASLVEGAGFEVVESRYLFSWLAPVKLAVALAERLVPRTPRPARVPPAPLNAIALWCCRLEQRAIASIRPPFGSSAIVVARAPLSRGGPPSP